MVPTMKHVLAISLILLSTLSYAEEVPNTFSSGDTISSSQINANFSFLADAMARGNVKEMMVCTGLGTVDLDNENITTGDEYVNVNSVFIGCLSTDNTTFYTEHHVCIFSTTNTSTCNLYSASTPFITWKETISQKWLLHLIDRGSNSSSIYQGIYYFYKISDQ